ncbi:MAG: hypothetical protein FGM53_07065 [Rhodocyclaceae bacterium]|nr:hypothetical protein [Rhodocyclaceae bacterium]
MAYKDRDVRRSKARAYTAAYRAAKKEQRALLPVEPRFCTLCGVDISAKRADARFCSREHKRRFSDKQRDYAAEYARNSTHKRTKALQYYYADIEASRAKQLQRQKRNPTIFAVNTAKRRAAKLKRTPTWLTEDELWMISQAYSIASVRTKMFGFAWHVDHIVPLQGEAVSGLHVPWNLQVIPGRDNIAKNNAFEVA